MADYENFELEDFVSDLFFMEWILNPTAEHIEFWEKWANEHPEKTDALQRARVIVLSLSVKPSKKQLSDEEVSAISAYFHEQITQPLTINHRNSLWKSMRWISAAAAILIATFIGIYFYPRRNSLPHSADRPVARAERIKITNDGKNSKVIVLDDGSLVVLRPQSTLTYPLHFTKVNREVSLQGEAFFDVRKNPLKPFLVQAANSVTKVLGTSFTVSAFTDKRPFKVMVNTGKVEVHYQSEDASDKRSLSVTLLPDQQVIFNKDTHTLQKDSLQIAPMLSPRVATKIFSFTNAPLSVIADKLEKAYQVKITYDKIKYGESTITASLSKLPLEEKIKAICKSIGAQYEFNDQGIQIK